MPRHSPCALISLTIRSFSRSSVNYNLEKSISVLYYSWIMQAHIVWSLFRQNCILPNFLNNKFPFMLPSHNCIIITMFSFQGASEFLYSRNSMKLQLPLELQSISWWRVPGSNRWPPACKAGALPAELTPHLGNFFEVVGQNGLEPSTSRLSVVCSSQLSYWPISASLLIQGTSCSVPSKLNNVNLFKHFVLTLGRY